MAPIVVPNICRFSVHQSIGGQAVVNIVDMQIDTTGSVVDREDACRDAAGVILNAWDETIRIRQVNDLTCREVQWLDLNSLTGSTGTVTSTASNTWPTPGQDATAGVLPAMIALRVDKAIAGGRGTKRGRMYICGLNEVNTESDVSLSWAASVVASWNTTLADFLDRINDQENTEFPFDSTRQMVVTHAKQQAWSEVTGLTVNPLISTQVRRGALR